MAGLTLRAGGVATALGRGLFGIPMVVFGIQHFIYVDFVITLIQPWIPGRVFWTYFTGVALIAAGTAIVLDRTARLAATLLGVMVFLFFLLVHIPQVAASPGDSHQWTYLTQAFTFSGIAFAVAASMPESDSWKRSPLARLPLPSLGRWLVAIGLLVLGSRQLLRDVPFVLKLVPAWHPGQSFWALLAGALLVATGAGLAVRRERVPAMLLGMVLLLFLMAFHVPSLATNPRAGDWGAACKNSILCGGAFVLAGARRSKKPAA
jgi:uncharacterized membrane protein